ncbi:diacylglycerol kinase [Halobacillus andaensis]|uniref:Diacylglycerol kinase n=1 Tax=Halobacillus andaensis TaxID=1176239 RepID=A0A917AYK8_HALAA|nr:diacylglycerol kinase family protein [Halobacillus andaensis]MBP2003054.1 diacylglycerol kinase [Halobacillus andaensis]GGF07661.1 diacylglycerol kinase [Halobacillus andaensis]
MNSDYKGRKKWIGLSYALNGLKEAVREERNLKIHLIISFFVIVCSAWFQITAIEWIVLILIMALVISLEMINSSIERVMDFLAPEFHSSIGIIKDIAAGAVLIAAGSSIVIGLIIFLPKVMVLL